MLTPKPLLAARTQDLLKAPINCKYIIPGARAQEYIAFQQVCTDSHRIGMSRNPNSNMMSGTVQFLESYRRAFP